MDVFARTAKKFLVAVVTALGILATALSDDIVTKVEWIQIAIAGIGALGVYQISNDPDKFL